MLEKTYQPAEIEARIHDAWMKAGAFKAGRPERAKAKPYCIVIPPPNVTGSLHMGHALNNTLQDILCRFERMRGRDVLWQPGTDHAGIATQLVVERQMMERQEPDRRKIGREKFLEKVWAWKAESGGTIISQLKRLGASCDWGRERFTMDEGLSKAVLKAFVDLYEAGLIYKDKRLVNWDPEFQSAISDLEVDMVEVKGAFNWTAGDPEKPFDAKALGKALDRNPSGHLYHFRYPLTAKVAGYDKDYIVVATTRPETMLGDTAVAVHPKDKRYPGAGQGEGDGQAAAGRARDPDRCGRLLRSQEGIGRGEDHAGARLQRLRGRQAPRARRWSTSSTPRRSLTTACPQPYRGLDRFAARRRVVADLEALGLVEKIEAHAHAVPHAQRGSALVEPWLTDQWYVNAGELAKKAIAAVETGKTKFIPENWEKVYFGWMRNIQPWCISRQLWWGHQIPAWYGPYNAEGKLAYEVGIESNNRFFVATSERRCH